jgi:patatin-related protein
MASADIGAREELRLAVVLNGGVSLAVWMGGVTLEIDRLTRREGPYGKLLELVQSSARVDVITGTSAGGINGAALALAQVNPEHARLGSLRDLWARHGRIDELLRTPFAGSPESLLKGDEYFLPELERALKSLALEYAPRAVGDRPLHLGITATLLRGGRKVIRDSLGQALPQAVHAGVLTFRHMPGTAADADDFSSDNIRTTVRRLALAARSSAGFPIAFEPSYLPAQPKQNDETEPADEDERPNMRANASWVGDHEGDQSRFTVDGGVLVNTPTLQAIEAIERLPSQRLVRRVMLLVYPHAPMTDSPPADREEAPLTVVETLTSMFGAMRNEAGRTHIEAVERHNQLAAKKRGGRVDVLLSLWQDAVRKQGRPVGAYVEDLHKQLYSHYRDLRIRRAARDLVERTPPVNMWSYERVLHAVERALCLLEKKPDKLHPPRIPFLWDDPDWELDDSGWPWGITTAQHIVDDLQDLTKRLSWVAIEPEQLTLLREAHQTLSDNRLRLDQIRHRLDGFWLRPEFRSVEPDQTYWVVRFQAYRAAFLDEPGTPLVFRYPGGDKQIPDESRNAWDRLVHDKSGLVAASWPDVAGNALGLQAKEVLVECAAKVIPLLGALPPAHAQPRSKGHVSSVCNYDTIDVLRAWSALLDDRRPQRDKPRARGNDLTDLGPADLITRLLRLDVVTSCLTHGPESESEQIIELAQISLQTENKFQVWTRTGEEKLGGGRLARFSGFLKESWRVNDWTWGRLDAATMLCRVVLEPHRVRRTLGGWQPRASSHDRANNYVNWLITDLFGDDRTVVSQGLRAAVVDELEKLVFSPESGDAPPYLEELADLFALALQTTIAAQELPALASAIKADLREGSPRNVEGPRLVADQAELIGRLKDLQPDLTQDAYDRGKRPHRDGIEALTVFDAAGVGREALHQEAASDPMIRVAASAMAVGATMLDSPSLGIKAIRPFTRVVRGLALVPYWLARGLAGQSKIAQGLALLALALGAALLGLSLLAEVPGWLTLIGAGAVLGGIGYSALRSGSLLHGLVLTLPVAPLTAYAVASRVNAEGDQQAPVVLPLVLLVLGLFVLGTIPGLLRSPRSVLHDRREELRAWWQGDNRLAGVIMCALAVFAVAVVVASATTENGREFWSSAAEVVENPAAHWWLIGLLAAWLVATAFAAHKLAEGFQTAFRPAGGTALSWRPTTVPEAVTATWAAVYLWVCVLALVVLLSWAAPEGGPDATPARDASAATWAFAASTWTLAVASVALSLAVFLLPRRGHAQVEADLLRLAERGAFPAGQNSDTDIAASLERSGTAYRYLTDISGPDAVVLNTRGSKLAERLRAVTT